MNISVVIPTHNPDEDRLRQTLEGLGAQSLPAEVWEILVVDNASSQHVAVGWCKRWAGGELRVIREENLGLSHARLAGIRNAHSDLVVFCDDDNVLAPDYLAQARQLMSENPRVGVAGGKSIPVYLADPPAWYRDGMAPLGCRDLGNEEMLFPSREFERFRAYPECAPVGAGMVFRKNAMSAWAAGVGTSGISDRKGDQLSSAGDCDMVLHALEAGYDVAYWPQLSLQHLIPEGRLTKEYLGGVSRAAFRDFVKVLRIHGIQTWPPIHPATVAMRSMKAWLRNQAWRGPQYWIRWQSAIGQFEGRAASL